MQQDVLHGVPSGRDFIRGIVISGDASTAGMQVMHGVVRNTFPELQAKVRMQIDPHFVGAVGAAQRARKLMADPEYRAKLPNSMVHDEL